MSEENIVTGEGFMDDWDYEYQKRIAELEAQLAEKDAEIARLRAKLAEKDNEIGRMREAYIATCNAKPDMSDSSYWKGWSDACGFFGQASQENSDD
jgi:uncharacterized coiled-coil protein SlyX